MRFSFLCCLLVSSLILSLPAVGSGQENAEDIFVEPTRIIHRFDGEAAGDQFGWTARKCGDLDNDGVIDFITTAPTHNKSCGKVYIYSSKDGKLLFEKTGQGGEQFGNSAVGAGDVNGDGTVDFLVGAPNTSKAGNAYVFSGADGELLHHFKGNKARDRFGYEVSELGDINGDGHADILVGAMAGDGNSPRSGTVTAYSGATGEQLFLLKGEQSGDGFGNAAGVVELKDGSHLLAVGAQNGGEGNRGQVYVYRIENSKPELTFKIGNNENNVNLGQMFISFPGDLNDDGVPDVYASDFSDKTAAPGGGRVIVCSGADGELLLAINGKVAGEGLGTSPSDAGDVNDDGIGDLVIGAWQNRQGARSGGKVYLYSCADGKLLRTWTCKVAGDTLGFDATGIGDVDGDGFIDFLLTSAWSEIKGPKTGRVFIVAGERYESSVEPDEDPVYPDSINAIIQKDEELGSIRNHACEQHSLHETVDAYAKALRQLDFSKAPDDFAEAFQSHITAWEASKPFFEKYPDLRGEMHDLFDEIRSMGEDHKVGLEQAEKKIWDTWGDVESAMEKHRIR